MSAQNISPEKHEIDIKEVIKITSDWGSYLWSQWKIILLTILAGLGLGVLYSIVKKPKYHATTTFVLENSGKSKADGYAGIAARFGLSLGGSSGGIFLDDDNMMTFIKSRTMISKTLRSKTSDNDNSGGQLLIDRFLDFSGLRNKWSGDARLSTVKFHENATESTVLEDSIITFCYDIILKKNLSVGKPDKEQSVIALTTIAKDELFAKAFNEKLLQNVAAFYIEYQTKKSLENVAILRFQVDSVRGLLNNALVGVAASTDANPNLNPAFQRARVPSQRRMVDVEMNKAILEELVKNLEISEISLRKETPLVQIIDKPVLPLYKEEVGTLKGPVLFTIAAAIFIIVWLTIRLFFKNIMADDKPA